MGFLFLILYPASSACPPPPPPPPPRPPPLSHTPLSHTIFHTTLSHTIFHTTLSSFTHHLSHTSLSTTIVQTPSFTHHLCQPSMSTTIFHTPSFTQHLSHTISHTPSLTHIFVNHHISRTIFYTPSFTHIFVNHHLSHTIFHTPSFTHTFTRHLSHTISHTPSLTRIFVNHHLSHTIFHTPSFTHTIFHTHLCQPPSSTLRGRRGTWSHRPSFCVAGVALMALGWLWWRAWSLLVAGDAAALCVAGVALGDIHLRFTWQAWHLETSTCVWRGRRGTSCTWWRAWSPLVAGDTAALCVARVALGDIHLRFARQAWHLVTSTFLLRGRRGTYGTGLALVARLVVVGRR